MRMTDPPTRANSSTPEAPQAIGSLTAVTWRAWDREPSTATTASPDRPRDDRSVHADVLAWPTRVHAQAGFEWSAVSSPGDQRDEFAERERTSVHAVRLTRQITPLRDLVALVRLWRHLRQQRPQIVHAHTPKAGLLGMIAARLARVPVRVYQLHGLPLMTANGWRRQLLRWSEWVSCRLAHQVLAVSPSLRDVALDEGLCPATKIQVLRHGTANGVDARGQFDPRRHIRRRKQLRRQLAIPPEGIVLGFVGRLVPDKGLVELEQAWSRLRESYSDLHLMVVGPEEPENRLPPTTQRRLREDPRVHLFGFREDPAPLYAAMDVVLLPSYREGFPTVPLEAAAMGLPVVATSVPGCVDAVVDQVTGQLVPPRCAVSLASAVQLYLRQPQIGRLHGQAGRARVLRDFQPALIWNALRQEYIRLLRQQGWATPHPVPSDRRAAA